MKNFFLLPILAAAFFCVGSFAHVTTCEKGKEKFTLEVVHPNGEGKPPCDVKYTKGSQEPKNIHHADNDGGYCDNAAKKFAEKKTGEGWTCHEAEEAAAPTPKAVEPDVSPAK